MEDRKFVSPAEALALLPEGEDIHTFRSGSFALIGVDWRRESVENVLQKFPDKIEVAGSTARRMGHGLCVEDDKGFLFIATDADKLNTFDPVG